MAQRSQFTIRSMSNLNNMSDSKSLRDTLAENVSDEGENIKNSDDQQVKDTTQQEVQKTAPNEEVPVFAEKVETKGKTPEQLEEIYQGWQKKYTQTRQKEREELKSYQQKVAELEAKVASVERSGNTIKDPALQEEKKQVQNDFDMGKMSLAQYTAKMRELVREDSRTVADEVFEEKWKAREEDTTQQSFLEKFNSSDPRFDEKYINPDSPEFDETSAWIYQQVAERMASELDAYIAEHGSSKGFKVEEITKKHLSQIDGYIDRVVKSRVQSNASQMRQRASETARSNPRGVTSMSQTTQRKGIRELIEEKMEN